MTSELVIVRKATWEDAAIQDAVNKIPETMRCGCEECMSTLNELTGALHGYVAATTSGYHSEVTVNRERNKLATWSGRVSQHMLAIEAATIVTEGDA